MIIVDFYGGPGSGKSTLAAGLFNHLKLEGVNCELVGEVAKTLIYEGRTHLLLPPDGDQFIVAAMQRNRLRALKHAGCQVAISDSPLPLQLVYAGWDPLIKHIEDAVWTAVREFPVPISVFCQRGKSFSTFGRYQADIEEAKVFDVKALEVLGKFGLPYESFPGNREGQSKMLDWVVPQVMACIQ